MLKQINQYYDLWINYGTYNYVVASRGILACMFPKLVKDAIAEKAYMKLQNDWQSGELAL